MAHCRLKLLPREQKISNLVLDASDSLEALQKLKCVLFAAIDSTATSLDDAQAFLSVFEDSYCRQLEKMAVELRSIRDLLGHP